jgi:MerR family transcriptional regulator, light-induced transcriptional regulator
MVSSHTDLHLTTTAAAELLSVHSSTVKRWADHGKLPVIRTEGGHRRVHLGDVLKLAHIRGIPTILDRFGPYEAQVWSVLASAARARAYQGLHALALQWLARGQVERLEWLFYELARRPTVSWADVCDSGVRDFMSLVAESVRSGRIGIGDVAIASEVLQGSLARLRSDLDLPCAPGSGELGTAVVGALDGNHDRLGPLCTRLLLERSGWRVFFLGADAPLNELGAVQRSCRARLVCVTVAPATAQARLRRALRTLADRYEPGRPYALAVVAESADGSALAGVDRPFVDLGLFASTASLAAALEGGFGRVRR